MLRISVKKRQQATPVQIKIGLKAEHNAMTMKKTLFSLAGFHHLHKKCHLFSICNDTDLF